jgi:Ni/Co efflux regulator RcnB
MDAFKKCGRNGTFNQGILFVGDGFVGVLAHGLNFIAALSLAPIRSSFPFPMEYFMKSKKVVCTLIALSLLTGPYAFAQGNSDNDRNNRDHQKQGRRNTQRQEPAAQRQQPNRGQNQAYANNNERYQERGAGPDHAYYRGGRMPIQYRSHQYVVENWRSHNLSAPPRGYHWVQSGSDYVLVAIATGIILQLLLNN